MPNVWVEPFFLPIVSWLWKQEERLYLSVNPIILRRTYV